MKIKETASTNNSTCPRCQLSHIKRNGHTYYGKQNYRCKNCGRQFVANLQLIGQAKRNLVKKLLLERVSKRHLPGLEYFSNVAA